MSKELRPWGIAGMPRGATHFAARLFGTEHEGENARGICDYMLAATRWPPAEAFTLLSRYGSEETWVDQFEFENRITVTRDPWRVLATNLAIRPWDIIRVLAEVLDPPALREGDKMPDFAARVMVRWYRMCLDFSDGAFFRAENPEVIIGPYKLLPEGTTIPPKGLSGGARGPAIPGSAERFRDTLRPETYALVTDLRKDFGYE